MVLGGGAQILCCDAVPPQLNVHGKKEHSSTNSKDNFKSENDF